MDEDLERHRLKMIAVRFVSSGIVITNDTPAEVGTCPACKTEGIALMTRRLNTAYSDEKKNWLKSCEDCYVEAVEYYTDLWNEYYIGQGHF